MVSAEGRALNKLAAKPYCVWFDVGHTRTFATLARAEAFARRRGADARVGEWSDAQGWWVERGAADVELADLGSVMAIAPLTDAARQWLDQECQTEPWQWQGGFLAVEHNYAGEVIAALVDAGLTVRG